MPSYMWMPPVHQQHKESMLHQTKGVSICPHTFGCPHLFGYPLYVWMPPICLDATICLDAPPYVWMPSCMFGHPMFALPLSLDTPLYGCLPHVFGHPLYVWMPSICLGVPVYVWMLPNVCWHPKVWGTSKHMGVSKCMGAYGHPLSMTKHAFFVMYMYSRHPNIFPTPGGIQPYGGHPTIWGIQTYRSVHTYSGGIQT